MWILCLASALDATMTIAGADSTVLAVDTQRSAAAAMEAAARSRLPGCCGSRRATPPLQTALDCETLDACMHYS